MKKTILFFTALLAFSCCKKDDEAPSLTDYPVLLEFDRIEDNADIKVSLFIQGSEITDDLLIAESTTAQELSNNIFPQRMDWVYQNITLNDETNAKILLSENTTASQEDYDTVPYVITGANYVFTTAGNAIIESTMNENNGELTIPYYSYYKVSSQFPATLSGHAPQSFINFFLDTTNFIQGDTMATIKYDVIYKLAE